MVTAAFAVGAACHVGDPPGPPSASPGLVASADPPGPPSASPGLVASADPPSRADESASWPPLDSLPWPEDAPPLVKAIYAGSWVPDGALGFDEEWIDEAGLVQAYTGRHAGRRIWQGLLSQDARLPMDQLVRDRTGPAVAYLFSLLVRSMPDPTLEGAFDPQPAVVHVRHSGRVRLRFDGEIVLDAPAAPPGQTSVSRVRVNLTDAFDVILLKLGRGSPELGDSMDVELRVSAPDGSPIPYQSYYTMRIASLPHEVEPERLR